MASNSMSKAYFVSILLACASLQSTHALPTRGSYASLARRAAAAKRQGGPSAGVNSFKKRQGASPAYNDASAQSTNAAVNAAYEATTGFAPVSTSTPTNPKEDMANGAGSYLVMTDTPSTPAASTSPDAGLYVAASNLTMPTSGPVVRRQQLVNKRVVTHPGEPSSNSIKINVVGGATATGTGLGFTLINATASGTPTSSSDKIAATSLAVNVINYNSSAAAAADAGPTVTETVTVTVAPTVAQTATVTLIPTTVPGSSNLTYVAAGTQSKNCTQTTLTEGNSTTVATICGVETDGTIRIEVDAQVTVGKSETAAAASKTKRNTIAFFEAPKVHSRDELLSQDFEDCIVGVDADCLEVPDHTRAEMLGSDWEDCEVGVDADCEAVPEE